MQGYEPVRHVQINKKGRDYAVGDIHGSFDTLLRAMDAVNFDQSCDRIFSVGDLIDRGPGSHRTARFLSHDWVYAVRGNHEDLLLTIYADGEPHPAVLEFAASRNGFDWWLNTPDHVRADILTAVRKLPIAIELATGRGPVGFVHADVPFGLSWQAFLEKVRTGDESLIHKALWSRERINEMDETGVDGIGRVFVGHTPLRKNLRLGNVYCIDTGCVFGLLGSMEGALTFAEVTAGTAVYKNLGEYERPADLLAVIADPDRSGRPFSR
ncbi:serine/threonine protein phosphatase 1 [Bradyrhizobium sp. USDA 4341]